MSSVRPPAWKSSGGRERPSWRTHVNAAALIHCAFRQRRARSSDMGVGGTANWVVSAMD